MPGETSKVTAVAFGAALCEPSLRELTASAHPSSLYSQRSAVLLCCVKLRLLKILSSEAVGFSNGVSKRIKS